MLDEIRPMGKSPIEDALDWLIERERLAKEIAVITGIPYELLAPAPTSFENLVRWIRRHTRNPYLDSGIEKTIIPIDDA